MPKIWTLLLLALLVSTPPLFAQMEEGEDELVDWEDDLASQALDSVLYKLQRARAGLRPDAPTPHEVDTRLSIEVSDITLYLSEDFGEEPNPPLARRLFEEHFKLSTMKEIED